MIVLMELPSKEDVSRYRTNIQIRCRLMELDMWRTYWRKLRERLSAGDNRIDQVETELAAVEIEIESLEKSIERGG